MRNKRKEETVMKKLVALVLCLMMLLCSASFAEAIETTIESRGIQVPATILLPEVKEGEKVPVVVFAHGHGGTRAETGFAAIMNELVKSGVACIAIDFPGCGLSTESFQKNTLTNMKADTVAALNHMIANYPVDGEKTGIFGYSMGGRIALEITAEEAWKFDGMALLAPAASTADLKGFFGGAEVFDPLQDKAVAEGYAVFTTMFGQVQELSREWFEDMAKMPENSPALAAEKYEGKAIVFYGADDPSVNPAISQGVADALDAHVVLVTGDAHSYGFYSDRTDILNLIATNTATFFAGVFAD